MLAIRVELGDLTHAESEDYIRFSAGGGIAYGSKAWADKVILPVENNEELPTDKPSISPKMVEDFIRETHTMTLGDKTTVVRAVLRNGFEIVESSTCVSAENYSEEMGAKICLDKIKDKVWMLLGFLLQTAVNGFNYKENTI